MPDVVRHAFSAVSAASNTEEDASSGLFLIVGSTNQLPEQTVKATLSALVPNFMICSIQVPLLAPTSQEQASLWTSKYWPTVYKKSNPFGPHPSIIARAEDEMKQDVGKWLDLAAKVAQASNTAEIGEAVGVVIVERRDGIARPVAVAGDARWMDWPRNHVGNVTAHATLRAIAMVAEGLKNRGKSAEDQESPPSLDIFQDKPVLGAEKHNYDTTGNEDGYLCHDLEIYCTHEPCVMCSMAIVHSRFGRIIFENRMPETGGICADSELGHGLFWRKELNWTLFAWEYARYSARKCAVLEASTNA